MSDTNSSTGKAGYAAVSALIILLSAFLLFQVQPVISKAILPWFGGSPAVWTTCMLFFQVLLLGGYAYSHWLSQVASPGRQAAIHLALLALALVMLPILPGEHWKPTGSVHPTTRILALLGVCVGVPYFVLSSTGPLVQSWFGLICRGRSPYWLYALSNIGSLAALLTYPFLFEPLLTTRAQGVSWSVVFGLFALLYGWLTLNTWRRKAVQVAAFEGGGGETSSSDEQAEAAPLLRDRMLWLLLPALASTALLAITNHLCQDVAVVPFMWVAPLSLYLLSFILCFAGGWWYPRPLYAVGGAAAIVMVCVLQQHSEISSFVTRKGWTPTLERAELFAFQTLERVGLQPLLTRINLTSLSANSLNECIVTHAGIYLAALFCICMLCHGEMVRRRPAPRHLTRFYLMTSAGGALGGIFVALVCPALFLSYAELNLTLSAGYLVVAGVFLTLVVVTWWNAKSAWGKTAACGYAALMLIASGGAGLVGKAQIDAFQSDDIATARSFYGVLHVKDVKRTDDSPLGRELLNGRILHGFQFEEITRRRTPTTYYTRRSGAGIAVETLRQLSAGDDSDNPNLFSPELLNFDDAEDGTLDLPLPSAETPRSFDGQQPLRVAVVGLGVGTMAAYGEPGDVFRFYEINPQVEAFAREHFTFLSDCPAKVEVVIGDARLSMEHESPQAYDLIVLDAFSGDAIPVHLLTLEAMAIYQKHLKPTGAIAIHVSNRHLDLVPVVGTLAKRIGWQVVSAPNAAEHTDMECASDWMLVTASEELVNHPRMQRSAHGLAEDQTRGPLWTDQFSNLLDILK